MDAFVTAITVSSVILAAVLLINYLLYRHHVKRVVKEFEDELNRIHNKW